MHGIYKHAHFLPDEFGHGGNKRTAQINELLTDAGMLFHEAAFDITERSRNKALLFFKGLSYQKRINTHLKRTYATGRYLDLFERFIKKNKPDLFIWESTTEYFLLLAEILHAYNIPLIAFPHNLESLVPGAESVLSNKTSPDWLQEEIKYLKYCKKVFTISREEAWLLSVAGVDASYLPYYPPRATENFFLDIRAERERNKNAARNKDLLLLGTFHNTPTARGYIGLIEQLKEYKHLNLHIAGYGSESINAAFNEDNVHVYGSVDTAELKRLMIKCDCALICQQPTSGALTRIPELLVGGIPVIANIPAARSYYDMDGLTLYHNRSDLLDILNGKRHEMPAVPKRPAELEWFADDISFVYKKR